jgi:hypothetical protein
MRKMKKKGKRERSARKNRRATTPALKSVSIYCTWTACGTIVWRVCRREGRAGGRDDVASGPFNGTTIVRQSVMAPR